MNKEIEELDKRIGTVMMHPVFGEIIITDVRKISGRTVAYYKGSFCNMNILTKRKTDGRE